MRTDFVHWYPLAESDLHAPAEAGVYQLRVPEGLRSYPTGRSAMVHYGSATNLREGIQVLRAALPRSDFLCRHQSSATPAVLLEFVRSQFIRRFGCAPTWSEAEIDPQS